MCCKHRRTFSFEMMTSEPKTTCNRPKSNAYVLHLCFCSVVRHQKICTEIVLKPSLLIFFLLLLLSFFFFFFVVLSYVFSWCVPSLRVPRVCYSVTQFVIQFLLRFSLYVSCFFFIFLFGFSSSFSVRLAAYLSSLHCSFCYVCFSVVLFWFPRAFFLWCFLLCFRFCSVGLAHWLSATSVGRRRPHAHPIAWKNICCRWPQASDPSLLFFK